MAAANWWSERESTLHLRASLEGEALDCGRGKTTNEILEGLRSRFGMSQDKAQTKLQTLRRQPKQSLHALGGELTKLAEIAYPDQGEAFCRRTVISCFYRAVNNRELEHLLANNKQTTLTETIRVAEDHIMRDERHAHPRISQLDLTEGAEKEHTAPGTTHGHRSYDQNSRSTHHTNESNGCQSHASSKPSSTATTPDTGHSTQTTSHQHGLSTSREPSRRWLLS